jgi:hypothetical protein
MANKITMTFAGDADSLAKETKRGEQALGGLGVAVDSSGAALVTASKSSANLEARVSQLSTTVSGGMAAIDALGGSLQAVSDLQRAGAERASRLARALLDVEQAQEDFNQALRDGAQAELDANQATLDLEQANIDASVALKEYNKAAAEFGAGSDEARQAALDLKQANQDAAQATEDHEQATRDASQAMIDAKSAQLDLSEAQREAKPPELQQWADKISMVTPLLSALVGVVGLVTAAQWAWNIAQLASPTTWIILAIVALVAIIVLIAMKTTWFQDLWTAAWSGIKTAASKVWDWMRGVPDALGNVFARIADAISAPFRAAFNFISKAWNNTIGRLSWSVPGWIPGIGGNTISAPKLPTFHQGGIAPGSFGREFLAVLQAGETVSRGGQGGGTPVSLQAGGSGLDRLFLSWLLELLSANNLALVSK